MYQSVTNDIEVTVTPEYLAERSSPQSGEYFWAYTIEITNRSDRTVQLKTRHWRITDGLGRKQDVKGAGVVGQTPRLKPGEVFEYTSGTPLSTPSGFMGGTYHMVSETGENFEIEIPTFSLDTPGGARQLN